MPQNYSLSDMLGRLIARIATEKALPFESLKPNDETVKAMKAARRGELVTVDSPDDLTAQLNEDR